MPITVSSSPRARLAVSVTDAAWLLSVSRTTVLKPLASGELKSLKLGQQRLIPFAALEAWFAARLAEADDAAQTDATYAAISEI